MARLPCLSLLCGIAAVVPAIKLANNPSTAVIKDVEYAKGLVDCPEGVQNDDAGTCNEKSMLLDVYPAQATSNESGPLFPAILIVHGGENKYGSKDTPPVSQASMYAKKGFVVFVPNYRLESECGTYPGIDFMLKKSRWSSLYPAVRDVKAALRFISANAKEYGVDVNRVVALGTSAGAMDILAAFTSSPSAFTKELSLEDDPTLSTTNVESGSAARVKALVVHSGNAWGIQQYKLFLEKQPQSARIAPTWNSDDLHLWAFTDPVPPLIQFHSNNDTVIDISNAKDLQALYTSKGVLNEFHVLNGGSHADWKFGCPLTTGGCGNLDHMAINFIYTVFGAAP